MALLNQTQKSAPPLSPEKQAQAEKAFQLSDNMMVNKETFDAIMQEVQKDPIGGTADAVVMILSKAKEMMGGLDKEAAMLAGLHLLADLMDMINQTGVVQYDSSMFGQILEQAVQKYLAVAQADGEDMNDLNQLASTFGGM